MKIIGVNIEMPTNLITGALTGILKDWKSQAGVPDMRTRPDKLAEYLAVWDAREGWTGSEYDIAQEKTFKHIADQCRESLKTVANRYYAAFDVITGHPYTPELWFRLMAPLKLSQLAMLTVDKEGGRPLFLRRPAKARSPPPAPESRIASSTGIGEGRGPLDFVGVSDTSIAQLELNIDIQALIQRGWNDDEICEEPELPKQSLRPLIAHWRQRNEEGL